MCVFELINKDLILKYFKILKCNLKFSGNEQFGFLKLTKKIPYLFELVMNLIF